MAYFQLLILLFLMSFTTPLSSTSTAYEVLEGYDFPVGLLPSGVLGYKLDNSTAGKITNNKLYYLSGIEVKVAIFWLSLVSVTRNNDELEFSVGLANTDFPVSNF
ncbi:uncharacterized protein LOC133795485 [Humulus lupulus]|uniref:uncharacterized protein LOC133795485 n=1 Tax=Humulus lupulus TaxID=3486 RepID=UPI002B403733|nr:uncharacterized protein LOC133795485 [Humulus lupulus]